VRAPPCHGAAQGSRRVAQARMPLVQVADRRHRVGMVAVRACCTRRCCWASPRDRNRLRSHRMASSLLGHHLVAADDRAGRARSRVVAGHREATRSAFDGARTARRLGAERGVAALPRLATRRVLSTAVQSRLMRAYEGPRSSLAVHSCSGSWLHRWLHSHQIRRCLRTVRARPPALARAGRGACWLSRSVRVGVVRS